MSERSRYPALVAAVMVGHFLIAPPAVAAGDALSDASFEARCAQLPPSKYEVIEVPLTYVEDGTQSIDQLTIRSGSTPTTHLTFGLTTVNFSYEGDVAIRVVEEAQTKRVCGALELEVKLSMQPVTVYLAQELAESPCARAVTFEHEMKHIAVFREVLAEAARALRTDIGGALGQQLRRAGSAAELERVTNGEVRDYLSEFIHRWHRIQAERQTAVDSPAEHARVKNACPGTG